MTRFITAAFAALLVCAPLAHAADEISPERLALAKQLMAINGSEGMFGNFERNMDAGINQVRQYMPSADEQSLTDIKKMAIEEFNAVKPQLMENTAEVYARHFSEKDLKALIAFYKTDTGKHFATELPALNAEAVKLMEPFNKRFITRLQQYIAARIAGQQKTPAPQNATPQNPEPQKSPSP